MNQILYKGYTFGGVGEDVTNKQYDDVTIHNPITDQDETYTPVGGENAEIFNSYKDKTVNEQSIERNIATGEYSSVSGVNNKELTGSGQNSLINTISGRKNTVIDSTAINESGQENFILTSAHIVGNGLNNTINQSSAIFINGYRNSLNGTTYTNINGDGNRIIGSRMNRAIGSGSTITNSNYINNKGNGNTINNDSSVELFGDGNTTASNNKLLILGDGNSANENSYTSVIGSSNTLKNCGGVILGGFSNYLNSIDYGYFYGCNNYINDFNLDSLVDLDTELSPVTIESVDKTQKTFTDSNNDVWTVGSEFNKENKTFANGCYSINQDFIYILNDFYEYGLFQDITNLTDLSGEYVLTFGAGNHIFTYNSNVNSPTYTTILGEKNLSVGGQKNLITGQSNILNDGNYNFINGENNTLRDGNWSFISGYKNVLKNTSKSAIFGQDNEIKGNPNNCYGLFITGSDNKINGENKNSLITGEENILVDNTNGSLIVGGKYNRINSCSDSIISGYSNNIAKLTQGIVCGTQNSLTRSSQYSSTESTFVFGSSNTITDNQGRGLVIAGESHNITDSTSSIISGYHNTCDNIDYSICGGEYNTFTNIENGLVLGNGLNITNCFYASCIGNALILPSVRYSHVTGRGLTATDNIYDSLVISKAGQTKLIDTSIVLLDTTQTGNINNSFIYARNSNFYHGNSDISNSFIFGNNFSTVYHIHNLTVIGNDCKTDMGGADNACLLGNGLSIGGGYTSSNYLYLSILGQYNKEFNYSGPYRSNIFVIGNGTSSNDRSNAFEIKADGSQVITLKNTNATVTGLGIGKITITQNDISFESLKENSNQEKETVSFTFEEIQALKNGGSGPVPAQLEARVSALETTVGNSSSGLVYDVDNLETVVGDSSSGIVQNVNTLNTVVGDSSSGIVQSVNTLNTTIYTSSTGLVDRVEALEQGGGGSVDPQIVARVSALETTVGDSSSGLVYDVDNLLQLANLDEESYPVSFYNGDQTATINTIVTTE